MSIDAWIVLGVLLLTLALLMRERVPPEIAAFLGVGILLATGALSPSDLQAAFSNPAPIAIAALFVLSAGLEQTGAIRIVARLLRRATSGGEWRLLWVVLPAAMVLSAFINNTLVVVFLTPVLLSIGRAHGTTGSRTLIPLSFAAILGGACTLIGTSTNLLVSSLMTEHGGRPMGMFEIAAVGLPIAAIGLCYLVTVAPGLLPRRTLTGETLPAARKEYLAELLVRGGSALVGQPLAGPGAPFPETVRVLRLMREGQRAMEPPATLQLVPGDSVLLSATPAALRELLRVRGAALGQESMGVEDADIRGREASMFEGIVGPQSVLEGRTLEQLELGQRYGAVPFAVHHHGRNLGDSGRFRVPLSFGDTVLLLGTTEAKERLQKSGAFLVLGESAHSGPDRREKLPLALGILVAVIVCASLELLPMFAVAILGALALILTGCVEPREAYRAIRWNLVLLIVGMLALGAALESSGAAKALVDHVLLPLGSLGPERAPLATLVAILGLSTVLTELITNSAAAALMVPIAFGAASALGLDPRPLCFGVAIGASASFASPIGYQTNLFVYGAGGYRFRDFLRVGLPLKLVVCGLAAWWIPKIWPLIPAVATP